MQRVIVGLAVLILLWSGVAQATAIFSFGNNPQPGEENILLNKGETGSTVTGRPIKVTRLSTSHPPRISSPSPPVARHALRRLTADQRPRRQRAEPRLKT